MTQHHPGIRGVMRREASGGDRVRQLGDEGQDPLEDPPLEIPHLLIPTTHCVHLATSAVECPTMVLPVAVRRQDATDG